MWNAARASLVSELVNPAHKRLHSKSVSFSLGFLIVHKNDLLVFGNTILQGGLCFVECVGNIIRKLVQSSFGKYQPCSLLGNFPAHRLDISFTISM